MLTDNQKRANQLLPQWISGRNSIVNALAAELDEAERRGRENAEQPHATLSIAQLTLWDLAALLASLKAHNPFKAADLFVEERAAHLAAKQEAKPELSPVPEVM